MLKRQFPNIEGLGHTLLQQQKPVKKIESGVQFIHNRDHWIVASNSGCDANVIKVYDSMYTSVAQGKSKVILNLFHTSASPPTEPVDEMQKQSNGKECGLYAIAVATNILSDTNTHNFQEQLMRSHLLECYHNNKIIPFP